MPIQQSLQHDDPTSAWVTPAGSLQHQRLVELLDRAVNAVQPTHDRGGHHRSDALIDRAGLAAGDFGHPGQRATVCSTKTSRGRHITPAARARATDLHRQDAVAAQVEERVIDPDPLRPSTWA